MSQVMFVAAVRRLVAATAASVASVAVSVAASAPAVAQGPAVQPYVDHLTVTVRDAGRGADGTYEVYCRGGRAERGREGLHPDPGGACRAVARSVREGGGEGFAPVARGSVCTMLYGAPATARVTGSWAGWPVDAVFDRSDGCEIARWDRLVPLLPDLRR
ncbi:hypothetical protein [Streptomyces flavalbus]|uniref:Subtilisin inhibitor domain-containing protein n=1 Tax=Streptomyces flavalbus TaxID=2665155 RepID=A0ABW2W9E7_9ACTN